jgi:hypothetical protein
VLLLIFVATFNLVTAAYYINLMFHGVPITFPGFVVFAPQSVGDFWLNWNICAQKALRGLYNVFWLIPFQRKRTKRAVCTFLTFLVSGLLHQWAIGIIFQTQYSYLDYLTGGMTKFFTLHGIIVILERAVSKTNSVPKVLKIIYTYIVIFWTAPLFMEVLVQNNVHLRIKV